MFRFKIRPKTAVFVFYIIFYVVFAVGGQVLAEEAPYLKYQDPQQLSSPTWVSTGSYILSLLATFLVVLGLAYFTSRIISQKMRITAGNKNGKIISVLSFGSGRGVYTVETAGKYLILGVTEQNINLLMEITDKQELAEIKNGQVSNAASQYNESFDTVFQQQLTSLKQMSQKFPTILKTENNNDSTAAILTKSKNYHY